MWFLNLFRKKRVLDWSSNHDPRSKKFPVRATLPSRVKKRPVFWQEGVVLDQGSEGACVGYGWTAELLSEPVAPSPQPDVPVAESYATFVYRRAQKIDEWEGEDYEGTSVLAGAKIMHSDGHINGYRWCFGVRDVRDAVIENGPVVIGVPWYASMYSTRKSGLVTISGRKVGGHCILVTGYHPAFEIEGRVQEVFRWRNSWGPSYGVDGSGFITYDDLDRLLRDQGEACAPVGRNVPNFGI